MEEGQKIILPQRRHENVNQQDDREHINKIQRW